MENLEYHWVSFADLDNHLLYEILQLRQQVFVIEQNCIYQDVDDQDQDAYHFFVRTSGNPEIAGYLRVIPPIDGEDGPRIGRVLVGKKYRGKGLARILMEEALKRIGAIFTDQPMRVSAQCYLQKFYESLGFLPVSESYDEDGIDHIDMVTAARAALEKPQSETMTAGCLRPDQLTDFARRLCSEEERQQYLEHIGTCQECYQKYTAMMMFNLKEQSSKESRGVIYLFNYPIHLTSLVLGLAVVGIGIGLMFIL